jgi:transcriptional regulator NrdR family protein
MGLGLGAKLCPKCGGDSAVYDTRVQTDGTIVRKRRCGACRAQFSTVEKFLGFVEKKRKNS